MKQHSKTNFILNTLFFIITATGIFFSVRLLLADRSLWLDEGYLAWSVSNRGLHNLVSKPLDLMQSAPVIYLYAVKLITVLFGNTEITLRLFSFISYIASLAAAYFLAKSLKIKYPSAVCACISGCGILLRYSCEFKPYMTDCAAVTFVILMYSYYKSGKLSLPCITAIYTVIIWLSNPACFFIAAIFIFEFFGNIKKPRKIIICGLFVTLSFIAYYIFWLHPVIAKGDMSAYWENMRFPLIPSSKHDIRIAYELFKELTAPVGIISIIAVFSCFKAIFRTKKPEIITTFIGFALAFIASYLGLFPIAQRMWLFAYPTAIILSFEFFDFRFSKTEFIISLALIFSISGLYEYRNPDIIFEISDNLNPIVDYLKDKDDFIYVYVHSVPTYCYRANYNVPENVMLGEGFFEDYNPDLEKILSHDSGYIVISHQYGNRLDGLFEALENKCNVTEVISDHGALLYYYEKQNS